MSRTSSEFRDMQISENQRSTDNTCERKPWEKYQLRRKVHQHGKAARRLIMSKRIYSAFQYDLPVSSYDGRRGTRKMRNGSPNPQVISFFDTRFRLVVGDLHPPPHSSFVVPRLRRLRASQRSKGKDEAGFH